jgi:hypothetical protein
MAVQFSNNAATNLSAAISASATSITVADASEFPTLSGSDYTYVTLSNLLETVVEVVKVTAISGNTVTVVRGQDNTTASAFASGDKCELRVTAALLNDVAEQADTNTTYTAGSGISLSGTTFSNAAPDQTVSLTGSGATSVSGTYPNFTISSTDTNTTYTAGTNLSLSGTTFNLNTNLSGLGTISSGAITSSGRGTFDELTLTGSADNLTFNEASGDWTINNAAQNNGITIYDGTKGVEVNYNGAAVAEFDGSGGMNLISGSLRVGGTAVIDSSRNLSSIGTIASGAITSTGNMSLSNSNTGNNITISRTDSGTSAIFHIGSSTGYVGTTSNHPFHIRQNDQSVITIGTNQNVNLATGGLEVGGTTVIDSSRNLTNIGTISSGAVTATSDTNALTLLSATNGAGVNVKFSDQAGGAQNGLLRYMHSDTASFGSGNAFIAESTEATMTFLADGKLMFSEGLYLKPSSGTGAGTQIISANGNLSNIGTISASGQVTADRFLSGIGSVASPAYKVGDPDSGFYDSGANMIGVALGGVLEYDFQPTKLDMKGNQLDNVGDLQVDVTSSNGVRVTGTDSVANAAFTTMLIDHNASGSDTTTADRSHIGLAIDMDSSATGGGTSHEHRLYGIHSHVKSTGDSDLIHGIYASAEAEQTAGTVTHLYGGYFQALGDVTGGTLTNSYGVYGYNSVASASGTTISNNYALYGKTLVGATQDSNVNQAVGVYGEVEIDVSGASTTLSSAHVFQAQFDNDSAGDVTINTGYLYYGNYAGTLPSTAYGVYIADAVRNYFGGTLTSGLGSTTAAAYGFNGDLNTGMYSPANHEVAFAANGTRRLNINASGAQITGALTTTGDISIGGNTVWHAGNDGSGSGLDADTVDGVHASQIMIKGSDLGGSVDLNNYTDNGFYHQNSNSGATNGSNYPASAAGMLTVKSDGVMVYQTYHQYNGNNYYFRNYYNGTWYGWRKLYHSGTGDLSVSGLVTADRFYSGVGTAASPAFQVGDTNTGFFDSGANTLGVACNGGQEFDFGASRLDMKQNRLDNVSEIRIVDTNTKLSEGAGNAVRITTNQGWVDIGAQNTTWCHFQTDRGKFYFQQPVHFDGQIYNYDGGGTAQPYWHAGNDGAGSGLDADLLDGTTWGTLNKTVGGTSFHVDAANFNGLKFWNGSENYRISMSAQGASGAGRVSGETTSDYNMYFKMDGGTNRGFVFQSGTSNRAGIDAAGNIRTVANVDCTYLRADRIYSNNDGSSGYFYNDSGGRTAYAGGDFYIQTSVSNYYNYATNQYMGNTSGDTIYVRGNRMTHNGWDMTASGHIIMYDNKHIRFGTGGDAEFFCNGAHMYIDLNSGIGNLYIRDGSTTRYTFNDNGSFTATGNITAYSDRRVKDQFEPITDALAKVQKLNGQTYVRTDMDDDDRRYAGLIAQDVEAVLPEAVTEIEDHLALDYSGTIALLVEAIKELKTEVNDLKAQLEER